MTIRWIIILSTSLGVAGCLPGEGEGWVVGSLQVANCREGASRAQQGDFDLPAEFFAGDPLIDFDDSPQVRRSKLTIRIQGTSSRAEEADGLMLVIQDVAAAARRFAQGLPIPAGQCFDPGGCPSGVLSDGTHEPLIMRAQLNMYNSCPDNRGALMATPADIQRVSTDVDSACLFGGGDPPPACPQLTADDQQRLQGLCQQDFSARRDDQIGVIGETLGRDAVYQTEQVRGNACLYLCRFGGARPGQDPAELEGFYFNYGDTISAIFWFNLVDGRALTLGTCAASYGQIYGMFSFELVRSRAAQTFP